MPLGFETPFGVPQVGVLRDVKGLPWTYRDYDRWTNEEQRAWTLDFLRAWLPLHPLVDAWRVEEACHIGGGITPLTEPILRLLIHTKLGGWFESAGQFDAHKRVDEAAFVSHLTMIAAPLVAAAGV